MKKFVLAFVLALSLPAFAALDDYGSGSLTAGSPQFCKAITRQEATATIVLSGTWTGTVTWQLVPRTAGLTPDATKAITGMAVPIANATHTMGQTTTTSGTYVAPISGFGAVCANFSTPTSGTVVVFVTLSTAPLSYAFAQSLATTAGVLDVALTNSSGVLAVQSVGGAINNAAVQVGWDGFNKTLVMPRICDKTIAFTTQGTTSVVKQIAEVATQNIFVCGWILSASTATTGTSLTWYSGSGANCASGSNAAVGGPIIPTTPTSAPATPNVMYGPGTAFQMTLAAGDALCTKQASTTNSTTLSGTIFYTQN